MSPKEFTFNGRICRQPTYKRSVEETTTYFRQERQANASELSFPDPVTIINIGCNLLYPIRTDYMLIAEESGLFFEAVRVKSKPRKTVTSSRRGKKSMTEQRAGNAYPRRRT